MMRLKFHRYILGFLVLLMWPSVALRAEHIIGAEIYYNCVSGNTYEVVLKVYRDCNSTGAPFDNPANFGIFDSANSLVFQVQSPVTSTQFVEPDLSSPCLSIPPDVCIEQGTYIFEVTLPDASQAYQIVYQRCCRNQTIQNLNNPGSQGLTVTCRIPPASEAVCNSRPSYNNFPPPVLCAQEYLQFDHSATDPDGDSLSYNLCSPFIGGTQASPMPIPPSNPPYNTVLWGAGFSAISPLNANPGLAIDPVTGLLTGTPTQLGQFVIGVCVEEWRDGVLLSVNTRDFQFNVAFCEPSSTAIIGNPSIEDLCSDLSFTFDNLSNPTNTFVWDFGDPNTETDVSTIYEPSYTYPDTGTYVVTLVTNPGFFCSDTVQLVLPLYSATTIIAAAQGFVCVNGEELYNFSASGEFNESQSNVTWDFGPNATPQFANGTAVTGVTYSAVGQQDALVSVVDGVCAANDQVTVTVAADPVVTITPQAVFCNGLNYQFGQTNSNATIFQWDFGVDGDDDDVSTAAQAGYTFPAPGVYTVTLTASNPLTCPVTTTEDFDIRQLLAPEVDSQPVVCFDGHSLSFEAGGSFTSSAQFSWSFPSGNPATSATQNPSGVTFGAPGIYPFELTITENGCTRSDQANLNLHANPIADFTVQSDTGCAPVTIQFINLSTSSSSSVQYVWDFGDGQTSGLPSPTHDYAEPGTYSVSLILNNLNGCIDSDSQAIDDIVTVQPSPIADFKIEPGSVSTLNPVVTIIDQSIGGTGCSYYFDGQLFEDCSFEHLLQDVVQQDVTQTVVNDFGCVSSITGTIRIIDHLIFIPNAFSPDADGLNDLFRPVVSGALAMDMYIYNRWGELIYQRGGIDASWNGQSPDEDYYAETGVYPYIIRLQDSSLNFFEYKGSVRLLR